jgi:sugar lactone lactonase YvrE
MVTVAATALWTATTACGDPVVVLGDLPGIMRVVVGTAPDQDPQAGPPATRVQLQAPRALSVSPEGLLYLIDPPERAILEVSPAGAVRALLDGEGCARTVCLTRPAGIALDGRGGVLVADPGSGRVVRVALDGSGGEVLAGRPGGDPPRAGAPALSVALAEPTGVAAAGDGSVYVSARDAHRIWRIERTGTLTPVAGTGTAGHRDGDALGARFRTPTALFLHDATLYVADQGNHRVRAVALEASTVSTMAGTGNAGYAGDGGQARSATFRSPEGVAVTADGRSLFISDKGNHRVRRLNLETGVVTTFAGTGSPGYGGSGFEAGVTDLSAPADVAILGTNFLFVADTGNRIVWRTPIGP